MTHAIHAAPPRERRGLDVERLRAEFAILARQVHGRPLAYLDNAASTQKPQVVLDALRGFYETSYANIHRGVHALSQEATEAYEAVRVKSARFLNAASAHEIVFVRGTTEGLNLVAQSWGRSNLRAGDEIVLTHMEHHSNIVPWQMLCQQTGAVLKVVPVNDAGELDLEAYARLLSARTRLVSVAHVSNALGTINPVAAITAQAHARGAVVVLDGAQAVPHLRVDVQALGCDFYALSGHKLYGPTGIGVLYGRRELLEAMPPWQGGGDMIASVSFERTTYNRVPFKFEAGTPSIADTVALGAAIDWLEDVGVERIAAHEHDLLAYASDRLAQFPEVRFVGTAAERAGVLSFVVAGVHPHDVGTVLDREGVAIRAGHHCAQPLMERFGVPATARASFAAYNTRAEVDALVAGVRKTIEVFR